MQIGRNNPKILRLSCTVLATAALFGLTSWCKADDAIVAVATNFLETAKTLAESFEPSEGTLTLASGSTGQIFAQINQGAPFHAFLSADQQRVNELVKRELADSESQFTYAIGRICFLLAPRQNNEKTPKERFDDLIEGRIAIANPKFAPYGRASIEALDRRGWKQSEHKGKVAIAQNVGQAYAMVSSNNADAGMVALSTVLLRSTPTQDFYLIPDDLHQPIKQDAVLLSRGKYNSSAKEFLAHLSRKESKAVIREHGYIVE